MSAEQFSNNASTTLGSALSNVSTIITVSSGTGNSFPSLGTGQFFTATLWAAGSTTGIPNEIVLVTSRSGDTMTVVRGQEGTTAQSWNVGDTFANYPTAGFLNSLATEGDLQQQAGNSAQDTGTANAGIVGLSPAPVSMAALLYSPVRVKKTAASNTGAYTLNAGFGAFSVTLAGTALAANQLLSGKVFEVFWDGATWELLSNPGFVSPGGPAGGGLTGTYPNPIIAQQPGGLDVSTVDTQGYGLRIRGDADGTSDAILQVTDSTGATQWGNIQWKADGIAVFSGAIDPLGGYIGLPTPVFTGKFTSGGITLTANTTALVAHGLGAVPFGVQGFLKNITPEFGYSSGELLLNSFYIDDPGVPTRTDGLSVSIVDATHIRYVIPSGFYIADPASPGHLVALTLSNWQLILRAWV